jgi:hypothetical protein
MGGGKDQSGQYEIGADFRMDFIFDYIMRALKVKMDKWLKMYAQEEYRTIIVEFFEKEENMVINAHRSLLYKIGFSVRKFCKV